MKQTWGEFLTGTKGKLLLALLLVPLLLFAYIGYQRWEQAQFTYMSYRTAMHVPQAIAPCSLPDVGAWFAPQNTGKVYTVSLVCSETGKTATPAQFVLWQEYVLWYGCNHDHNTSDCMIQQR